MINNNHNSHNGNGDLVDRVKKPWNELPKGKFSDLPDSFARGIIGCISNTIDYGITLGGIIGPIEGEDTKAQRLKSTRTKYGVAGTYLGYTTMGVAIAGFAYGTLRMLIGE